jgi:dTDP-4-dehydrorhamnose reductase
MDSLRNGKAITVAHDHFSSPTLADNLAEAILKIVGMDAAGVYHVAGSERTSRYSFNVAIFF